ncbi:FAD-dependent oxidoreductase [Nocardioides aestuarii]|uniref:D-amino-acid oxidase n=1 Tax=Nocardioides aestuarii TaxID=252231 RepID=A0ABW4TSH1_9ACTN
MGTRIVVVGAGVVGLTVAVRLAEAGHRVDVVARDLPLETTSVVAAALWYPYEARPHDRVAGWGARGYAALADLAGEPASGVRLVAGTEVLPAGTPDPWWAGGVPDLARTPPPLGWDEAWSFTAPLVDMPVHLVWLREQLEAHGGTVTRMSLAELPRPDGGLVVNCSGMGARLLAHETDVHPACGQVLLLEGVDVDRWWLDGTAHDTPTYVVPRTDRVVVGGTFEEGDWSRTPDPATAESILRRAARLVPAVADGRVVAQRVGLRPVRSEVRLERVGDVVHCYGHGGAGVTLAQGCADEVLELASR